jgi:hypothetical protein
MLINAGRHESVRSTRLAFRDAVSHDGEAAGTSA